MLCSHTAAILLGYLFNQNGNHDGLLGRNCGTSRGSLQILLQGSYIICPSYVPTCIQHLKHAELMLCVGSCPHHRTQRMDVVHSVPMMSFGFIAISEKQPRSLRLTKQFTSSSSAHRSGSQTSLDPRLKPGLGTISSHKYRYIRAWQVRPVRCGRGLPESRWTRAVRGRRSPVDRSLPEGS